MADDITISYNNSQIASLSDSGTKTLQTSGKYCTDNITINYTKPSGGGGITTALVSGLYASAMLYYTDANMTAQSATYIKDEYLPVGSIVAIWDNGPSIPLSPIGVTQIAQYGSVARGMLTVYKVVAS